MSIKKLQVEEFKIEPKHPAFAKLPKELYPDVFSRKISFELMGLGSEFANAIRVCTMEEIEWKALEVDEAQIKYDDPKREPDIIIDEFCMRIGLIPIRQDTPNDAKFSLQVANTGNTSTSDKKDSPDIEYRIVYSGDLKQSGGSGSSSGKSGRLFDSRFRLVALSSGKIIEVNNIGVVTGKGYENAKFNTCSFEFQCLDYVDAYYLSAKEQINSFMTSLTAVRKESPKKEVTAKSKVIIIPDSSFIASASERTKEKIKNNYDIVLENSKIQPVSSSTERPKHYYQSFTFFCDVDPKKVLVQSLQTLKDRIDRIRAVLQEFQSKKPTKKDEERADEEGERTTVSGVEKSFMEISMPEETESVAGSSGDKRIPTILIRGEDHVIGNLIVKTVLDLDSNTPFVNYEIKHPSNRSVIINIMHQEPIKIIIDALSKCYDIFDNLQKQVTG